MKKLILRLEGGLGNQLFQYAFARALQEKYGCHIVFDLHTFKTDKQRDLSLYHFNLNRNVIQYPSLKWKTIANLMRAFAKIVEIFSRKLFKNNLGRQISMMTTCGMYLQQDSRFADYLNRSRISINYIKGNWMSAKYFSTVARQIKSEYKVITSHTATNAALALELQKSESVCVHIRRGDYASSEWADKLLICDFYYYEHAIKRMNELIENPVFYIFSNTSGDLAWIKDNYKFSVQVNFVDLNNPDYEEFRLMSSCRHFILSNSSFSWWASYLSDYENKKVIAPSKWNTGVWDVQDIYLPTWEIIKID